MSALARALAAMPAAASRAVHHTVTNGAEHYERRRLVILGRLLPGTTVAEIDDISPDGRAAILRRIERAVTGEERRGVAGHWTYDPTRLTALRQALAGERLAASAPRKIKTRGEKVNG